MMISCREYLDAGFNVVDRFQDKPVYVRKTIARSAYRFLMENEIYWLDRLSHLVFVPNIVVEEIEGDRKEAIVMTYAGEPVTMKTLPSDWREQVNVILEQLKKVPCSHNDIKVEEILVNDGRIMLIDYHHATASREEFVALKKSGMSGCNNNEDDYCALINILGNMEKKINKVKERNK